MIEPRRLALCITPEHEGRTVDSLLRHELHLSGTALRRAKRIPLGITVDGQHAITTQRVQCGQLLSIQIGDNARAEGILPQMGPLTIAS